MVLSESTAHFRIMVHFSYLVLSIRLVHFFFVVLSVIMVHSRKMVLSSFWVHSNTMMLSITLVHSVDMVLSTHTGSLSENGALFVLGLLTGGAERPPSRLDDSRAYSVLR